MSEPPDLMKEVARWTEKAEHDFLAAGYAMEPAKEKRMAFRPFFRSRLWRPVRLCSGQDFAVKELLAWSRCPSCFEWELAVQIC